MKKYIIVRLLLIGVGVFLVITVLFFTMNYSTFNRYYDMPFSDYWNVTTRLYKVFLEQRVLKGDWGLTIEGEVVAEVVLPRLWTSLKYNLIAIPLYLTAGLAIGTITAYYKGSIFDKLVNGIVLVIGSLPIYLLVIVCLYIFAYVIPIFPSQASFAGAQRMGFSTISGYGIPMMVMCAYPTARIAVLIRAELIESINSDHYALCLAKGLNKRQIYLRHMLRETLLPLMPTLIEVFIYVLTGSFFLEITYGIEGAAALLYESLIQLFPDFNINYIQIDVNTSIIVTAYYMLIIMLFTLLVDIVHNFLDPRVKVR